MPCRGKAAAARLPGQAGVDVGKLVDLLVRDAAAGLTTY